MRRQTTKAALANSNRAAAPVETFLSVVKAPDADQAMIARAFGLAADKVKDIEARRGELKRSEAVKSFNKMNQAAEVILRELSNPELSMVLMSDFGREQTSKFKHEMDTFARICSNRAKITSTDRGNFNFANDLGLPSTKLFVAVFVTMICKDVLGRKMPDDQNVSAADACTCLLTAAGLQSAETEIDLDEYGGWSRHIMDARNAVKLGNVLAYDRKREWPPKPREQVVGHNAVEMVTAMLRGALAT